MRLLIAGAWRKDCKTHNVGTKKITRSWFLFRGRICALIALAVCILVPKMLQAQTVLYWDTNGTGIGATNGTTASGTWNNTNKYWNPNSAGTSATKAWTTGSIADFAAGTNATAASTVTVTGTIAGVAGLTFDASEGPFTLTGGTLTLTGTASIEVDSTTATISSVLGGTVGMTKTGSGTLILSGANTYTGATTVSAGILSVQNAGALGTAANTANTTVASGATLQLLNAGTTTNAGTLVLNGTGMGGAGALQSASGNNTWNGGITLASDATIFSATAGNTLTIDSDYTAALNVTMGSHTLTVDGPGDTWFNANVGVTGDTGGLIKNGTGTLTFYGYNTNYTGATTVNAGTLALVVGPYSNGLYGINGPLTIGTGPANPAMAGSVNVNIQTNSYGNQISPTSAVTINSDGALNVGASTSVGSLTLNGGQLNISSGVTVTPTGDITSNVNSAHQTSLISGGSLTLNTGNFIVSHDSSLVSDLTISSSINGTPNLNKSGTGTLTLSGANTYTGATNINAGTLAIGANNTLSGTNTAVTVASGATLSLNNYTDSVGSIAGAGSISLGSGAITAGANNTSTTFSGIVSGSGSLTKSGTGTLTLSGVNTYTGGTNINAGTLALGANNTLAGTGAVAVAAGATLTLNNYTQTIGALSGAGTVQLGTGRLIAGSGNVSSTFSGAFASGDTGTFTKTGTGILTVGSGLNLAGGTLELNGGTLNLNGTSTTIGTLSVTASSTIDFTGASILTVLNSVIVASGQTLTITDWTYGVDYFFDNQTGGPASTTLKQIVFTGYSPTGTNWQSMDHEITPVPEPSGYGAVFMFLGLCGVAWKRLRAHRPTPASNPS